MVELRDSAANQFVDKTSIIMVLDTIQQLIIGALTKSACLDKILL
jgi:hypothetical protein